MKGLLWVMERMFGKGKEGFEKMWVVGRDAHSDDNDGGNDVQ